MANAYRPAPTRFWEKVSKTDTCWLWTGSEATNGYGQFSVGGRLMAAHRWAYEQSVGSVPDGLDLDHLCNVRLCVNPGHLEPVTRKENVLRAHRRLGSDEHCRNGHPRTPENVHTRPDGSRYCRECKRIRDRARPRETA